MKRMLLGALCLLLLAARPFSALAEQEEDDDEAGGLPAFSAADAAQALRAAKRWQIDGQNQLLWNYDYTQNGAVDGTDAKAALWSAAGKITDFVKFVERISTGIYGEKDFEHFRYNGVYDDQQGNYESDSVSVHVTRQEAYKSTYFVADIYVQDVRCIATAIADPGTNRLVQTTAAHNDAVLAVNGDYYTQRNMGPIFRNGELLVPGISNYWDICIMTRSGELVTFPYKTLTQERLDALDVYQSWVFGPILLDEEGKAAEKFRTAVANSNPRTVLGYYEPGHYCFICVDGRQGQYSVGMTMRELADICEQLGLKAAYNLDGGQSAAMATRYGLVSKPYYGGRPVSDIVYVRELPDELVA